jgi:hypothetical protein
VNTAQPTQQTPAATPTAPAAPAQDFESSYDDRVAALKNDESSATAGETPGASVSAPPATHAETRTPPDSPAASDDPIKRAEERRARLDAMKMAERQRVDDKQRQTERDKLAQELVAAKKRAEDLEARVAAGLDPSLLDDPIRAIRAMEKRGVAADKVAEAIRESIQNPEIVAERAARAHTDPQIARLEQQLQQQNQLILQLQEARDQDLARAQEHQQTQAFLSFAAQSAATAPLSVRLLETDRDEFMAMLEIAGERISPGAGAQALLDQLEEVLDSEGRKLAEKYAALYGLTTVPSQPQTATPPRAAAKATTVSNTLAQGRAAVVEDEGLAGMSFEERIAALKR